MACELMVKANGVGKHFCADKVLDDVSLAVPKGSVCIIIGPSGSGQEHALALHQLP